VNLIFPLLQDAPEFANKTLKAFLSSDEGSLVACLVREFLEFFQLDFTLSVFDPETAQGKYYSYGGRTKLMKDLHIENWNGM
jgi:FGFR1 oncogene partner